MPEYDPGPSTERTPFVQRPRIMAPDTFQSIGAGIVAALAASELRLGGAITTIASLGENDLSGDYAADVAPALEAIGVLPPPSSDPELVGAAGVLEEVIGNLEELATVLPDPFESDEPPETPALPDPDTGKD